MVKSITICIAKDIALIILCPHESCVMKVEILCDAKIHGWQAHVEKFLGEHFDCNKGPRDE